MSQHHSCFSVTAYGHAALFLTGYEFSALVLPFLVPLHPSPLADTNSAFLTPLENIVHLVGVQLAYIK